MISFDQLNLNTKILKAIAMCGYTTPTPIQQRAIPEIINQRDIVAVAQTGTGKTAAFVLPALHNLLNSSESSPQSKARPRILILTPTRELAAQVAQTTSLYGKFAKVSVVSLVGGMSYPQQIRNLSRPVDIIIATPGRLLDHLRNKRINLSSVNTLIFDEADRMLDMGFIDDVQEIAKLTPKKRQTLLFSATVDSKLDAIIKELMHNPVRIEVTSSTLTPTQIKQELYITDNELHKIKLLRHFLAQENIYKAIIFTATKINAEKIARQLREHDHQAHALHGDLKQNIRNRTLDALRCGKINLLVATDVAARGIDIADISHVFNYDLPKFHEDYVHRIGRTGRAGKEGTAISFALPHDTRQIKKIERYTGQNLSLKSITGLEPQNKLVQLPSKKKSPHKNSSSKFNSEKKKFWIKDNRTTQPKKIGHTIVALNNNRHRKSTKLANKANNIVN